MNKAVLAVLESDVAFGSLVDVGVTLNVVLNELLVSLAVPVPRLHGYRKEPTYRRNL